MSKGVAISDVIRSMMRAGYSQEDIYDLCAGIGLPGEQVQLLMDRISAEFHGAKFEPRPSRLASEVDVILKRSMEESQGAAFRKMDMLASQMELVKMNLEKVGERVAGLKKMLKQFFRNDINSPRTRRERDASNDKKIKR